MIMVKNIIDKFFDKKILILGVGIEGKSTYNFIRKYLPEKQITLLDKNIINDGVINSDSKVEIIQADDFLPYLPNFDMIIKSPGIPSKNLETYKKRRVLTSQTEILLKIAGNKTIGITGTKGKSTTSSLIYEILKESGISSVLLGNIGKPPLSYFGEVINAQKIVMELSAHQLQFVDTSPNIAVLTNLYPEHLDYFPDQYSYYLSKLNIAKFQNQSDSFIYVDDINSIKQIEQEIKTLKSKKFAVSYNSKATTGSNCIVISDEKILLTTDNTVHGLFDFKTPSKLIGEHNRINIAYAAACAFLSGVGKADIEKAVSQFQPLEHRIEFVGKYKNIYWYNDSIATVPQATIQAVKSVKNAETLILGGSDKRNLNYDVLYNFLYTSEIKTIIFIGDAGRRMIKEIDNKKFNCILCDNYDDLVIIAQKHTSEGKASILSPAASSYDYFKNFEERGRFFKKLIKEL